MVTAVCSAALCCSGFGPSLGYRGIRSQKELYGGGTLKRLDWTNPHIYVCVEVKQQDGQIVLYGICGGAGKGRHEKSRLGAARITFTDGHSIRLNERSEDDNTQ